MYKVGRRLASMQYLASTVNLSSSFTTGKMDYMDEKLADSMETLS